MKSAKQCPRHAFSLRPLAENRCMYALLRAHGAVRALLVRPPRMPSPIRRRPARSSTRSITSTARSSWIASPTRRRSRPGPSSNAITRRRSSSAFRSLSRASDRRRRTSISRPPCSRRDARFDQCRTSIDVDSAALTKVLVPVAAVPSSVRMSSFPAAPPPPA